jgi:serine phosphatase RsbU (regulator of sigma subunit)
MLFIFVFIFFIKAKSQEVIKNIEKLDTKYILNFYFSETKFSNDYIPVSKSTDNFVFESNSSLPEKTAGDGIFVFRSYFTIDKSISNNNFGLHLGPINYPCKIFLNGNLILNVGHLGDKPTTKIQFSSNVFFPPDLLKKDTLNEISFQAYIKEGDKTSLGKIFISSTQTVETYTFIRNLLREDIVQASVVFSLILSIYFLFGFFQKRDKNDKKYLYFALFCLGFSIGYANLGLSYNFIDDLILYRITRMGIPFAALFLVFYTIEFTKIIKRKKIFFSILTIPIVIYEIIYFIQPDLAGIEKTMGQYSAYVNLPYMIFSFVLSIIAMIKYKMKRHFVFFLGFIILFIGIFHDTYYYFINVIAYTWVVPISFLFLIIATFFILASEQTKIFHLSVERGEELLKIKENLEKLVEKRTEKINQQNEILLLQSENLKEVNSLLEETNAEVLQQKEELMAQTENLRSANTEITNQRDLIKKSHTEITASINYARRIQKGLLPKDYAFKTVFSDCFVVYLPKDIVSGDFYFLKEINDVSIIVTGDCTGHGVPGAFMSLLGIAFLNEIVTRPEITKANQALEELRIHIKNALHQKGERDEQKDGIDLALCVFDSKENVLQYSGANNPIFIIKNDEFIEYKPVRNPIGIYLRERSFENHFIDINKGDTLYMFTDGIYDQFGGEHGRKYRLGNFRNLVIEINKNSLENQRQIILDQLQNWQQDIYGQTDDITVIGIRI